jgi:hypothetical protein
MSDEKRIQAEVVDPDAPVRFVRLTVDGDEKAMIPWDEAVEIYNALDQYTLGDGGDAE